MKELRLVQIPVTQSTPAYVPHEQHAEAVAWLKSWKAIEAKVPGEQPVFRMLDVGAGYGLFAVFAGLRFPYAYLDCFEPKGPNTPILKLNVQPGTRIFSDVGETLPECDALHVSAGIPPLGFDAERLTKLRVAIWEFRSDESFENQAGFMRAMGLTLAHVAMVDRGPPVRGWQMWIRRKA